METFAYIADRNPMPSVFKEVLRRRYELRDEPLPSKLEEIVQRLPEAGLHEERK